MPKPQLHVSGLMMLAKCGEQFRRRYIEGEIIPPGVAMIVGTATHRSIRANLQAKIESGRLLGVEATKDIARDALRDEWDKGVWLQDEERTRPKATQGEAIDKAVRLSGTHAQRLAPALKPTHVERKWTVELPGYPMDLVGEIDIQEAHLSVRDTKTSAKSPSADAADRSEQLTMYALAVKTIDHEAPEYVALDYLVDLKSGTKIKTVMSSRAVEDFEPLLRRVENAARVIESGSFVPARPDDWWCNPKWCGFYSSCPFVRRRR